MKITEIACKSALHHHQSKWLPFEWDLNVYRGCTHGCKYCYAMYSHSYIDNSTTENYFRETFVKSNIVEQLAKELASPKWKGELINLGGVTDNYQHAEAKYKLMPDIWRLLIKHKNPVVISTKSDLILRDYDLIAALARVASVQIAVTVTTADYGMQRLLEPGAVDADRRFIVLREFSKFTTTGLHMMPVIPYMTDCYDNIDSLMAIAASCKVSYVLPAIMNLRGATRQAFFDFLLKKQPAVQPEMLKLYGKDKTLMKAYKKKLYAVIRERMSHYGYGTIAKPSGYL
ncbi:MAG: radical SAM protein [Deferribacteraceae bacterium]|jgi:DNA repair photolyase|nr:radical SAM protein [Deferribacteraceae bacterium]